MTPEMKEKYKYKIQDILKDKDLAFATVNSRK